MNICIVSPSFGYGGANIIAATLGKELDKTHNLVYYSYKYTDNYSNLPEEKTFFFKGTHNKILDKLKKVQNIFLVVENLLRINTIKEKLNSFTN